MNWLNEKTKRLKRYFGQEQHEFEQHNSRIVLSRIRIISLATICFALFWIYMDYTIAKNGAASNYIITLVVVHVICVAVSMAIVAFYNPLVSMIKSEKYSVLYRLIKAYVFLYILTGAVSSINSQSYAPNMNSYIILSLVGAVAIALKPSYMLTAYLVNHIIFLIGLRVAGNNEELFLVNTMNSTVMIVGAFLLSAIFYRHRMVEFFYKKELVQSSERFKKLFDVTPYPAFITRLEDGKIIEANEKARALLGIDVQEQHPSQGINCFMKSDSILALREELIENESSYNQIVEYQLNGKQMWVTANYELIDYHGEKCVLAGVMDVTQMRKNEEELTHHASTDTLTGIMNRRMGIQTLEHLLAQAKEEYLEFVLCFLDINDLKKINDTYGHSEGDHYILIVCDSIKRHLREEDVLFRMGGDEFIIILKNRNKAQAEEVWKRIQQEFKDYTQKAIGHYGIMASHGFAYYHSGMEIELDAIIEHADKQMYKEKQQFRVEDEWAREIQTKE